MKWWIFSVLLAWGTVVPSLSPAQTRPEGTAEGDAEAGVSGPGCRMAPVCLSEGTEPSAGAICSPGPCGDGGALHVEGFLADGALRTRRQADSARSVRLRRPLDRRVHYGYESWERVVPTHTRLQYAGSIGVVSAGFGWDYGRRGQWETDLLLGVLPSYNSDKAKFTFTLKGTYIPWSIALGDRLSFEPLSCGAFLSTILSDEFWVREPDRYPKGYYFFSTRIRSHVFFGSRLACRVNMHREDRLLRSITVYYELSTCDLYVISRVKNRTLRTRDILSLSFGVRFQMFDMRHREGRP